MSQTQPDSPGSAGTDLIRLSPEAFLDSFPDGAALVKPDGLVAGVNSRMHRVSPATADRPCYEILAGLPNTCPFCPFDKLALGTAEAVTGVVHVRGDRACSVDVRFLPHLGEKGMVLETVRPLSSEECAKTDPQPSPEDRDRLLKKLKGLVSVGRELIGSRPFEEKMVKVLRHVSESLDGAPDTFVWAEVDDRSYGTAPAGELGTRIVKKIAVAGTPRGHISAAYREQRHVSREEEYFLEETADLIGRKVEIHELEDRLRQSEEKYKKLAGNLAKEMWTRTEALAKETGYLEGILRCSDDMIVTTDLESRIVEFNPAAEDLLGYTAEEMQGRKISDIWVNAREREKVLEEINVSGGIRNYETLLRAKSGEIREISLTLSLLKDEEGRILGTVGVSKDIGKEMAFKRELERLNRNYMETIHFISHETKNSLIVIGGFVKRLLESETDPARKDQLKIVYHHSQFLEAMSRDFLVMAELEHGEFQIRRRPIRNFYEEVILPAMIGLKERYPDSFESYDSSMGGVGAVRLMGDPGFLEVVYRNLFGNALKYRSPGGKIAYGVVDDGDSYTFNVWNEGSGVPREQCEQIFEKFYRVRDDSTRDKRGTGLGLYNIRKIIEAHHGRIWCETQPGKWINFLFVLPKESPPS